MLYVRLRANGMSEPQRCPRCGGETRHTAELVNTDKSLIASTPKCAECAGTHGAHEEPA